MLIKTRNMQEAIRNNLSVKQKQRIRKILQFILMFLPGFHNLKILSMIYETDKWSHGYTQHYQNFFDPLRLKKLNILEIGVGGYKNPKDGGGSLRTWQKYFPKSMVYAIDIYDKSFHEDKRIKIFRGSQNDPEFLKKVAIEIGPIDIIIDDGSHINKHVKTSFFSLFPYLKERGIYAIEDIQTSYSPKYGGNSEDLSDPGTMISLFKNSIDGLNHRYIPRRLPSYFDKNIASIHFYPNLTVFCKGENHE